MIQVWIYNLSLLLITWIFSLFSLGRFFLSKKRKTIIIVIVLIVAGLLLFATRQQFMGWYFNETTKYFLPPYQSIYYFLHYTFSRFWGSYLVSFFAGFLFLFLAKYYNKKHGEKFFEKEEPYFISIAMFLAGTPGWFLYLALILISTLLFSFVYWLISRRLVRIPYYNLWLPLGILVIILDRVFIYYWPFYWNFVFSR